jgi:NADH:ubiquinone oxidoreductase subunit 2 (subunit N)
MPIIFIIGHLIDNGINSANFLTFDMCLAFLLFVIMFSFKSLEAILLLLFAFIGQYYMLHSIDLLSFYVALEAQNFCFLVLCGLPCFIPTTAAKTRGLSKNMYYPSVGTNNHSFSVEASLKYFLLSAFSSGVILF